MRTGLGFFLVVCVGVAVAGGDQSDAAVYQYTNPDAKEVGKDLGEYLVNIYVALEEYLQDLSNTCSTAVSLREYNTALKRAKGSRCATTTPEGYKDADKTIAKAAAHCKDAATAEDLEILITEIEKAQNQVKKLDELLSENKKGCSLKKISRTTCETNEKQILSRLVSILSKKETARFQNLLRKAYFNTKKIVDGCMDTATKNLKQKLDSASKSIKDCLGK